MKPFEQKTRGITKGKGCLAVNTSAALPHTKKGRSPAREPNMSHVTRSETKNSLTVCRTAGKQRHNHPKQTEQVVRCITHEGQKVRPP